MTELPRMTLGGIERVAQGETTLMEEGSIEMGYQNFYMLNHITIKMPNSTRTRVLDMEFKSPADINSPHFLDFIDRTLEELNLYLTNITYTFGDSTHTPKLKGMFYLEKPIHLN